MRDVTRTSRSLYRFGSRDELEQPVIERCRGTIVGYFAPTGFAGATNEALGLIVLPSVAAHERYRDMLDNDPEHKANVVRLAKTGEPSRIDLRNNITAQAFPRESLSTARALAVQPARRQPSLVMSHIEALFRLATKEEKEAFGRAARCIA